MSRNPSCRPYLPRHLIEELKNDPIVDFKTSMIHSPDTEQYRLLVISQRIHPHVPVISQVDAEVLSSLAANNNVIPALSKWGKDDRKSHLHLAAATLDIPLAYETLRMGANPSYKDAYGVTPLYLALELARSALLYDAVLHISAATPSRNRSSDNPSHATLHARASRIATLLVEQHGDVNSGYRGRTPLSIAVELCMWDIVELLLRHRVKVPPLKRLSFPSNIEKLHYLKLLTSVGSDTQAGRPLRPCPCWSGKPLAECHAAGWMSYPGDLLCCCGKNRKYDNCCVKREFKWMERWSEENQMFEVTKDINQVFQPHVPDWIAGLPGYSDGANLLQQGIGDILSKGSSGIRDHWRNNNQQQKQADLFDKHLKTHPEYEPAYSYAYRRCDVIPRPWQNQQSKMEGKSMMDEWNALVDEYIASGKDRRSRFDIERLAKIGAHGGPLYRQCEADECRLYEVRDVETLRKCSGCKIAVYCSSTCQKADWQTHKKECGTPTQRAQQLPMQRAQELFVAVLPALMSVWNGSMTSEELLMSVIERDIANLCGVAPPTNMVPSPLNDVFGKLSPGGASTIRSPLTF